MRSFKSLATSEQINAINLLTQLQAFDPELYLFKSISLETNLSPMVAVRIYQEIANVAQGSGYGKIAIYLQDKKISSIEGERRYKVEEIVDLTEGLVITTEFMEVKNESKTD